MNKKSTPINIAPCGLVCSHCDAYRATQENSAEKLKTVAATWSTLNHCKDITPDNVRCDGCLSDGCHCAFCENLCPVRKCILERGYSVCSQCSDYPCQTISGFLKQVPAQSSRPMKKLLAAIAEVEKSMHSAF